jgi:hypothetical protein
LWNEREDASEQSLIFLVIQRVKAVFVAVFKTLILPFAILKEFFFKEYKEVIQRACRIEPVDSRIQSKNLVDPVQVLSLSNLSASQTVSLMKNPKNEYFSSKEPPSSLSHSSQDRDERFNKYIFEMGFRRIGYGFCFADHTLNQIETIEILSLLKSIDIRFLDPVLQNLFKELNGSYFFSQRTCFLVKKTFLQDLLFLAKLPSFFHISQLIEFIFLHAHTPGFLIDKVTTTKDKFNLFSSLTQFGRLALESFTLVFQKYIHLELYSPLRSWDDNIEMLKFLSYNFSPKLEKVFEELSSCKAEGISMINSQTNIIDLTDFLKKISYTLKNFFNNS